MIYDLEKRDQAPLKCYNPQTLVSPVVGSKYRLMGVAQHFKFQVSTGFSLCKVAVVTIMDFARKG
jgi:hypothetical protein